MKIAMLGHKQIPSREGGIEVVVTELSTRMARLGHSVVCYNRRSRRKKEKAGIYRGVTIFPVWTLDRKGLAALTASLAAAWKAARSDCDVVHIHAEGPALFCWIPRLFGKQVVVTVHGLDWQREKWQGSLGKPVILAGEQAAVRYADAIIVLSRSARDYFWRTYQRRTILIPNGVTRPRILPPRKIREQFGLEKDGYILFLGRLVPEKGVHLLIEAFRQVKTEKKLVIAGGASDTDAYAGQLKALAKQDNRVLFPGFVQGELLAELYSNAYVYVLPSSVEGMPLSLLEAMSYGSCCLVSDIPECREVVQDKAAVFSAGCLEEALQRLCDAPSLVERCRAGVRDFVCEKYDWNAVTEQTLAVYRQILGQKEGESHEAAAGNGYRSGLQNGTLP